MKASTHPLTAILGRDVPYPVPLYQRPYVWKKDTEALNLLVKKVKRCGHGFKNFEH